MTNIKDIIIDKPLAYPILKIAGELGKKHNLKVFVVGGFVRDLFLNRKSIEVDLMVEGDGIKFSRLLADELGVKKIVPFKEFGTAKIPYPKMEIEVASARLEDYDESSRKPKKVKYTNIFGDLKRRDFTINAMAVDLLPKTFGDLYDPYNGIADLKAKCLTTPLDPDETFSEDPLRMMRAAVFASRYELEIDDDCLNSMRRQANRIQIVSWERITAELIKILEIDIPSIGLIILQQTGLLKYVFPEIDIMFGMEQPKEWHHKDIFYHTMQVVDNSAQLSNKMELRFAALVHDIGKPKTRRIHKTKGFTFHGHDDVGSRMLQKIAKRMKLSNDLRDYLTKMTILHLRPIALAKAGVTDSAVRRLMVAAGEETDDLLTLCRADITSKNPERVKRYMGNFERVEKFMQDVVERDKFRAFQSPVRGNEIMQICGLTEGKKVGQLKSAIEDAILDGKIENSHEAAYNYLLTIKDDLIK
ncbi:MAG: HD domain-containing protein [Planctomycetia bacterium]|nr:HD domain-containing protein [Planctomycetia bacterium]